MATYAIIAVGGKQYRVQEGERLLVDRVATDEGKTFHPSVLLFGDDKKTELSPSGVSVTARRLARPRREGDDRTASRATVARPAFEPREREIEKIGGRGAAAKAEPGGGGRSDRPAPSTSPAAAEEQPRACRRGTEDDGRRDRRCGTRLAAAAAAGRARVRARARGAKARSPRSNDARREGGK